MLRITCPWCGERDYTEFRYGGDAVEGAARARHRRPEGLARPRLPVRQPEGSASRISGSMCWAAGSGSCWSATPRPTRSGRRARRASPSDEALALPSPAHRRPHRPQRGRSPSRSTAERSTGFAGDTLASALLANGVGRRRPQLQVSPAARDRVRRRRGAERAASRWARAAGASRTFPATTTELVEGHRRADAERLALGRASI